MRGIEERAMKFSAYTLFCHHLLNHLTELQQAILNDPWLDSEKCYQYFDKALSLLFTTRLLDWGHAIEVVTKELGSQASSIKGINLKVSAIFEKVISEANADTNWNYENDIEKYHNIGYILAKNFYKNTSFSNITARLTKKMTLDLKLGGTDTKPVDKLLEDEIRKGKNINEINRFMARIERLLADEKKMAPLSTYLDTEKIIVRFDQTYNFALYLTYPFMFMHEYTSHVFATDYDNERFNDGWLMYAAEEFLTLNWNRFGLQNEQSNPFFKYILEKDTYDAYARRDYKLALKLSRMFSNWNTDFFQRLSFELADFDFTGSSLTWHNDFITALEEAENDPDKLKSLVLSFKDLKTFYNLLVK